MNRVPTITSLFASRCADKLVVHGQLAPTVEPQDTAVDVNHETQPSTIRNEKGSGCTLRSIVEEFLLFKLRFTGNSRNRFGMRTVVYQAKAVSATASTNAAGG